MKLRSILGITRRKFYNKQILANYVKMFRTFSADSDFAVNNGRRAERSVLIQTHVLEKGLSHKSLKPFFGYKRISTIPSSLKEYLDKHGDDNYVIGMATSAINTYNDVNSAYKAASDCQLLSAPDTNRETVSPPPVGSEEISRDEFFEGADKKFADFCKSRHSLRMYDCKSEKISYERIKNAIEVARFCPNACNRQAVRVKVILDPQRIQEISKIKGGADGFGGNSGAMLIVTSDISLYTMGEHGLALIDCGIFIMNLVYALYEKELGSCVLNCCLTEEQEENLREIIPISKSELVSAMICVSDIPKNETVKISKSERRPLEDIVQLIK